VTSDAGQVPQDPRPLLGAEHPKPAVDHPPAETNPAAAWLILTKLGIFHTETPSSVKINLESPQRKRSRVGRGLGCCRGRQCFGFLVAATFVRLDDRTDHFVGVIGDCQQFQVRRGNLLLYGHGVA
jgi:hypothetical protein